MDAFKLPNGRAIARLGQGTWRIGEQRARRDDEIAALRLGLDLGLALIDTAEMYGDGGSEELIGEAIAGRRDEAYLVSKVLPTNASRRGTISACERSLERLAHRLPRSLSAALAPVQRLADTVEAFESLAKKGFIRAWGVGDFDRADLEECVALPGGDKLRRIKCSTGSSTAASSGKSRRGAASTRSPSWRTRRSAAARAPCGDYSVSAR